MLNEEWIVERNNNVRWLIGRKSGKVIADRMDKKTAFHIEELHNKWLNSIKMKKTIVVAICLLFGCLIFFGLGYYVGHRLAINEFDIWLHTNQFGICTDLLKEIGKTIC